MTAHGALVQAEFFNVGNTNSPTLERLLQECDERIAEGLPLALLSKNRTSIKTVVRFFDNSGEITELALRARGLENKYERILDLLFIGGTSRLYAWWTHLRLDLLQRQKTAAERALHTRTRELLHAAIRQSRGIAVEKSDHHFRMLRDDERHELLESTTQEKPTWVFVFHPNHLLSDQNKLIVSVM